MAVATATGMDGNGKNCGCSVSGTGRTDTAAEKTDTAFEVCWTKLVIGICVLVFAIQMIRAGSLNFEVALNSFDDRGFLAVAAIPEGLCGSCDSGTFHRCNEHVKPNAIIRRLTVETLGCAPGDLLG